MKEHSLEIVDIQGNTVLLIDGSVAGGLGSGGSSLLFSPYKTIVWPLLAASVDSFVWVNSAGVWQLVAASSIISASGGTSAAVQIRVGDAATAIASATAQLSAALDLEETAPDKKNGTLIASPTKIYPGMVVSVDFSGTLTALVGVLTMDFKRVE